MNEWMNLFHLHTKKTKWFFLELENHKWFFYGYQKTKKQKTKQNKK